MSLISFYMPPKVQLTDSSAMLSSCVLRYRPNYVKAEVPGSRSGVVGTLGVVESRAKGVHRF